jgi:hypothetical protein
MRMLLMLVATLCWGAILAFAARMLSKAQSPPAAYAAATLGVSAFCAWCISLLIIWLAGAWAQTGS